MSVRILDPLADRNHFGPRYCTGGYIFQISDYRVGDILAGPTFPRTFDAFHGQGIPDAFNQMPLRSHISGSSEALVLGIGVCNLAKNTVVEFCDWGVVQSETSIVFATNHSFQGFEVAIRRTVSLEGRTIRSTTTVENHGDLLIPVNWFPHPFFPQNSSDDICVISLGVQIPKNPGFSMASNGFIRRKGWPWDDVGHFQSLNHDGRGPLTVLHRHPTLGLIAARFSYTPAFFPLWGNRNAISWEPYLERSLCGGTSFRWWIDYDL